MATAYPARSSAASTAAAAGGLVEHVHPADVERLAQVRGSLQQLDHGPARDETYVRGMYDGVCLDEGVVMPTAASKNERLNVRLSSEALDTIRGASSVQQQDITSFVLGAALERARAVLVEDRLLRLTPHEVQQLERALDREPAVVPQLAALLRSHGEEAEQQQPVNG